MHVFIKSLINVVPSIALGILCKPKGKNSSSTYIGSKILVYPILFILRKVCNFRF